MNNRNLLLVYFLFIGLNFSSFGQANTDAKAIQNLIQNSFDELFSDFNSDKTLDFYTEDFLLLERGEVWDLEKIQSYFITAKNDPDRPARSNRFEFIQTTIDGNRAWVAYENYATFSQNGVVVGEIHWLESATAVKTKKGWRLDMLHSTPVNEKN